MVDLLLKNGVRVTGVDNLRTGTTGNMAQAMSQPHFRYLEMDACDSEAVQSIKDDIDVVFHLAAISSVTLSIENPLIVHNSNVTSALNVLELARTRNAKRAVLSSSAAVYGNPTRLPVIEESVLNPLSPYAASKISAESYFKAYGNIHGIEPVILRYFNVYGPRQAYSAYSGVISIFINQALNNQSITVEGDGSQTRSFIYVDDVVEATYAAAQSPKAKGQAINISGTDSTSILDLSNRIKAVAGSTSKIIHMPPRKGDVRQSIGAMKKAARILDFTPRVGLDEGLSRTVDWYRQAAV